VGHSREVKDRETGTWKLVTVKGIAAKIKCKSIYTIFPDGEIVVSNDAYVPPSCPPVPRIGVQCMFSGALDNLTYYGRGPKECYWDRKTGYPIGKYEFKVDDMHVPYLFPTENGNRADVQWAALTDKDGFGVVIQPLDGQDTFEVTP
jgi:beta-galactosidase